MADITFEVAGGGQKKLRDMLDGSHAERMSAEHATTGLAHGSKAVTTAGTPIALAASSTPAKWVIVQARVTNTGYIAVGGAGVLATLSTGTGILLAPGESVPLPCDDLADIYIDATVNGESVRFSYGI